MDINIKLSTESATNYATYYGFVDDGTVTLQDFVTSKILERIQNDVTEYANRQALAGVTPIADVTSDLSQTALKESIATAMTAKMEASKIGTVKEAPVEGLE